MKVDPKEDISKKVLNCLVERDYKQWNVLNQWVYCYTHNRLHRSCFSLFYLFFSSLVLT